MKKGFTLSEVLITLGIIGVVAALTLPSLITKHQKRVVATNTKSFFSIMHQAVLLKNSQENSTSWLSEELSKRNNDIEKFYNDNFDNNIKSIGKTTVNGGSYLVALANGSGFYLWRSFVEEGKELQSPFLITYCPNYKYCKKNGTECYDGRNGFLFKLDSESNFTPYCSPKTNRTELVRQCAIKSVEHNKSHCCSALLQVDNWEIKDDYAFNINKP